MAIPNNPRPVDHELGWPEVAEVVPEDLLFVVHDHGVCDSHPGHGGPKTRNVFFVVGSRCMNTNDHEALFSVLVMKVDHVRHRLDTWFTIERPEIEDDDFTL